MFAVRLATADDLDFIIHSWLFSLWGSPVIRGMERDDYFLVLRPCVKGALANSNCMTLVACAEDDPNVILGWICVWAGHTAIWAYTKKSVRNMGVIRECLQFANVTGYALPSSHVSVPSKYVYRPQIAWTLFGSNGQPT